MYPSLSDLHHDPRWAASGRLASLWTVLALAAALWGAGLAAGMKSPPPEPRPMPLDVSFLPVPAPPLPEAPPEPDVKAEIAPAVPPLPPVVPLLPESPAERTVNAAPAPPRPVRKPVSPRPPKPDDTARPQSHEEIPAPAEQAINATSAAAVEPSVSAARTGPAVQAEAAAQTASSQAQTMPTETLLARLAEMIERHKDYPKAARRAGYEGIVVMAVTVDENGVVVGSSLDRGSPHALLDRAAEKAVGRLLGERIDGARLQGELKVLVPIRYELHSGQG